jgi:Tol biopolymer transport system component
LLLISVQTLEKKRLTTSPAGFFDTTPAFSPDGRTLAFTRAGFFRSGICLIHLGANYEPQGVPPRFVTPDTESTFGAAWTADGNEIVSCYGLYTGRGLWRMSASVPREPMRLSFTSDATAVPAISRQGNRLVYEAEKSDTNIYRVDLGGPGQNPGIPFRFISSTRIDALPAYSPDGKKIAFSSNRSGAMEIWLCASDGSNAVQLTTSGGGVPKWSPDGRTIVYRGGGEAHAFVHVISADGGVPKRLTAGPFNDKLSTFSRDGKSIYFASERSGMSEIWKVPAGGGDPVQITPNGEERDIPEESPEGKFLYYGKGAGVWRMPVAGGKESMVLDSVHPVGGWALWEQGIYFFRPADEKGHSDICLYEFATGKTRKVLTIEKPIGYYIESSPDGRSILYTQSDQAGSDLMLVENFR